LRAHAQVATTPVQDPCRWQKALGQDQAGARKISPIVVVTDPVQVQAQTDAPHAVQTCIQTAVVLAGPAPAGLIAQAVLGHQVQPGLATVVALQVTKFSVHRHATLAHQVGGDAGVAVGRDVKVVGLGQLYPVGAGDAHHRRQQARLALAGHREGDGGYGQHRKVLKAQLHPLSLHGGLFFVQVQSGGLEHPCRQPVGPGCAPAGGVVGFAHGGALLIDKLDLRRLTVGAAFVKFKSGLRQRALETVDLQCELGAGQQTARSTQAHLASGLDHVLALVIGQLPSLNAHARLADAGLTLDQNIQVRPHAQALALQVNRSPLLLALRDGFFQQGTAAQDQTRQRGCGCGLRVREGLGLRHTHRAPQRDTVHHKQNRPHHLPQKDMGQWGLRTRDRGKGHKDGAEFGHTRGTGKALVAGFVK